MFKKVQMRIFLDKKGICGTVFPMRAGCAKQRFNLPWPHNEIFTRCWYLQGGIKLMKFLILLVLTFLKHSGIGGHSVPTDVKTPVKPQVFLSKSNQIKVERQNKV